MATWRVIRQDDNGNVYVVADGLSEAAALEVAADLEARGHKQLYQIEPSAPGRAASGSHPVASPPGRIGDRRG